MQQAIAAKSLNVMDGPQDAAGSLLSIIIVNYNGKKFIPECLESVQQHVHCDHEVIIVDNASADGSAEFIRNEYPDVVLVESHANLGFTGGNNLGARYARGELLLLLNNDTKLLGSIQPALDRCRMPGVGAVGAHLFYADMRSQISVGYEHSPLRIALSWLGLSKFEWLPRVFRRAELDAGFYDREHRDVAWVCGAFLVTPRAVWQRLGGLDDSYFMYVEDVDYCKQVRLAGLRVDYLPEVHVLHYEGAGKPWLGEFTLVNSVQSYRIYLHKFYGSVSAGLAHASLIGAMALRACFFTLQAMRKKTPLVREKRDAYWKAVRVLLGPGKAAAVRWRPGT
jgi:GT2 family glycosyltransferase